MKKALGNKGEDIAANYLTRKGFKILRKNYTAPTGEIDIVARDGDTLVFVEVKARTGEGFGSPAEAVGERKQRRIRSAALHYMANLKKEPAVRFDVVSVMLGTGRAEVEHIVDAFESDGDGAR